MGRTEQALMAAAPENAKNDIPAPLNRLFSSAVFQYLGNARDALLTSTSMADEQRGGICGFHILSAAPRCAVTVFTKRSA